jgi:hypothetical protein
LVDKSDKVIGEISYTKKSRMPIGRRPIPTDKRRHDCPGGVALA